MLIKSAKNRDVLYVANYTNVDGLPKEINVLSKINKSSFPALPSKVKVTLLSCHTGQSPTGIASTLSKILQLEVGAPRDVISVIKTEFSTGIPPIPTFWNARKSTQSFLDDHACKFFPDGSSQYGALHTKVLPVVKYYAPLVILSIVTLFCFNKYK